MATETLKKRAATLELNNGTDSTGKVKVVSAAISGISSNATDWDAQKYLNIVALLEPCLSKAIEGANMIATYGITPSA